MTKMNFKLQILAIGISIATMAIAPSLVDNLALAQGGASANKILIDTDTINYQCTTSTANPATSGLSVNAHKEGNVVKGEWNIKGTDKPGEKKGTITGGTFDKTKYDLKGKETTDTLCEGKVPKDITISGDCGDNKQINFRIVAGSHEVFNGFVECS